jgi:flavin reductase (DIM6/NTAB) family NADH-FMN oxidoreductase RutF
MVAVMDDALDDIAPAFRQAMRRLTSTVCVVTGHAGQEPVGMTMTAVTSVSMEPPSLLICANRSSRLHAALVADPRFCVNVLRVGHDRVAAAFAGRAAHSERFGVGRWTAEAGKPPFLEDALANLFCVVAAAVPHGSHTVLIGAVQEVCAGSDGPPLIYGDGRYGPG